MSERQSYWLAASGIVAGVVASAAIVYLFYRRRSARQAFEDYVENEGQPYRPEGTAQEIDQEQRAEEVAAARSAAELEG